MLDQGKLKDKIQQAIEDIFPSAFEDALQSTLPKDSDNGNDKCKEFGEAITKAIAEPFAEQLSSAIDYYVRNAKIFGKFQILGVATVGSMVAQTQVVPLPITVDTLPTGLGGGNMPLPNTLMLGIQ